MNDVYAASGDEEIAELERELRKAQLTSDIAALDRLISDDLLFSSINSIYSSSLSFLIFIDFFCFFGNYIVN